MELNIVTSAAAHRGCPRSALPLNICTGFEKRVFVFVFFKNMELNISKRAAVHAQGVAGMPCP